MSHWLYPANTKFYDVFAAFNKAQTYWPMNSKVLVGDVIFIYLAAPYQQIGFVSEVLKVDLDMMTIMDKVRPFIKQEIDDTKPAKPFMLLSTSTIIPIQDESPLSFQQLKFNGLNGMLMGPRKLENNPALLNYITANQNAF